MIGVKEKVYNFFDKLNLKYKVFDHKAIFCEKDSFGIEENLEGIVCKNLFLKNKNNPTKYYLLSLPLHKRANIKEVQNIIGVKKLTFGNENELFNTLGVKPGSVSILNIIERPDADVTFLIDKELFEYEKVCFHPNDNTSSITFYSKDLIKILENFNTNYDVINIGEM